MADIAHAAPAAHADRAPLDGSFDEFVRTHRAGLVRYATLLSGSVAQGEDIVQEVLVRIYLRWASMNRRPGDALAYVRRAVTNEHVSWRRRWTTRHVAVSHDGTLPDVAATERVEERDEQLWQSLLQLPSQQRAALVLRFYESLDDDEIADVLQCRPGTVRAHVSRGLARLRRYAVCAGAEDGEGDNDDAA